MEAGRKKLRKDRCIQQCKHSLDQVAQEELQRLYPRFQQLQMALWLE